MKTLVLVVTAFLLTVLLVVSQSLLPNHSLQAQVPTAQTNAGLEFEGFGTPNTAQIVDVNYQGDCPGEGKGDVKARFYSTTTPPGSDRRVVVRNVSRGLTGDAPFTDRDYSQGRTSESTSVEFGTQHELTHFVMVQGQNDLQYEIKQGNSSIERGAFTAQLAREERSETRDAICSQARYCSDEGTPLNKCKRVRVHDRCFCPNRLGDEFFRNSRDE